MRRLSIGMAIIRGSMRTGLYHADTGTTMLVNRGGRGQNGAVLVRMKFKARIKVDGTSGTIRQAWSGYEITTDVLKSGSAPERTRRRTQFG